MDIHNQEFKHRGRKGYDRYEVDRFLDRIVNDYGDSLDQEVDLKNQNLSLKKKLKELTEENSHLQQQVSDFTKQKAAVNQALVSAQKSADQIQAEAHKQAAMIVSQAKTQTAADRSYAEHQVDTLSKDYKRLKKEIAAFRTHLQKLLEKQIANLNDDEWQQALDQYFHTTRFYPGDGSEPIATTSRAGLAKLAAADEGEDDDELMDTKAKFLNAADSDKPDVIDPADLAVTDEEDEDAKPEKGVDKGQASEVNSSQTAGQKKEKPQPMTGDSPSRETINVKTRMNHGKSSGPTIIFPDDYKDHN